MIVSHEKFLDERKYRYGQTYGAGRANGVAGTLCANAGVLGGIPV